MNNILKIAKEYYWEMGHRLPKHKGLCRNIHGHSYKMRVEVVGEPNADNSMVLDYYELSQIVEPIISQFNHAFVAEESDKTVVDFMKNNSFKCVVLPFSSTAENLCIYFTKLLKESISKYNNIHLLTIRIYETVDVYAEISTEL
jgi:6-pyruvoyltetrahydropterin/6-carboxytetrahydropterin synthase